MAVVPRKKLYLTPEIWLFVVQAQYHEVLPCLSPADRRDLPGKFRGSVLLLLTVPYQYCIEQRVCVGNIGSSATSTDRPECKRRT
jgi:hypothetical protein